MARELDHIAVANRNHETLLYLIEQPLKHPEWIATVAFYKAVHIVEAVFAAKLRQHSNGHDTRIESLKHGDFKVAFKSYRPLYAASLVARYLEDSSPRKFDGPTAPVGVYTTFTSYMPAEVVVSRLICNRLYTLEQSLVGMLTVDGRKSLKRIGDIRAELSGEPSVSPPSGAAS